MDEIEKKKVKELFKNYFLKNHSDDLKKILKEEDDSLSYSVHVECMELLIHAFEIAHLFFIDTLPYLELLNCALLDAQKAFYEVEKATNQMFLKPKIFPRLHSLPPQEGVQIRIPRCEHVDKLVSMNGTIVKASVTRMLESSQEYVCKKCGTEFNIAIDFSKEELISKPTKCAKPDCNSDKFQQISTEENFKSQVKDYQEIKVQEKFDSLSKGSLPQSCLVILEDDLVDMVKPGDDVTINGIVLDRWNPFRQDLRPDIDLILKANSIEVHNQNDRSINITKTEEKFYRDFWHEYRKRPITGRNIILCSLCPQLYGMYIVKLAVGLILAGGVSREDASGTRVRGESHLLLVGDPGTGKSQFLKYANKIVPRSVLTTGIGSTSAGLTATASREGGLWHLEAGALVLADGGICCVDEFNCMKEQDRASMLEAMEQQTISVAKAGIVCKLKTQCSVLAACNPKGKYDSNQPITVNVAISSPLLSRFDIVLLLMDSPNEDWDKLASTFLLQGKDLLVKDKAIKPWKFEEIRLYMNYIKKMTPMLTPDANLVIQKYYQLQRQSDDRNAARTTVRMLESVIRLSQAHAKLMLRDEVMVMDAVVSITLMECSLNKSASFGNVNILHTSFPDNAEVEYRSQVELILNKLGLTDLLRNELKYIDKNFEPFCNQDSFAKPADPGEDCPSGTQFNIISQLIGGIPTQKTNRSITSSSGGNMDRVLNSTATSVSIPKFDNLAQNKINETTSTTHHGELSRKRHIDVIGSPSIKNLNDVEPSKKPKLSSQVIRKLNQFEFTEKNDVSSHKENVVHIPPPTPPDSTISSSNRSTQQLKNMTIMKNTETNSQRPKLTQSQKSQILNINNDDLDFDI